MIGRWQPYSFQPIGDDQLALIEEHGRDLQRYGLIDDLPEISDAVIFAEDASQ